MVCCITDGNSFVLNLHCTYFLLTHKQASLMLPPKEYPTLLIALVATSPYPAVRFLVVAYLRNAGAVSYSLISHRLPSTPTLHLPLSPLASQYAEFPNSPTYPLPFMPVLCRFGVQQHLHRSANRLLHCPRSRLAVDYLPGMVWSRASVLLGRSRCPAPPDTGRPRRNGFAAGHNYLLFTNRENYIDISFSCSEGKIFSFFCN